MSGLINKVKDAVHSDKKDNAATDNPQSSNAGPYGSNMANKADPRVDSDRDTVRTGTHGTHGAGMTGTTGTHGTHGTIGTHGTTGAGYGSSTTGAGFGSSTTGTTGAGYDNPRSVNDGPHGSNMANKADPRIDSDRDGRAGGLGSSGTTGAGYGSSTAGTGYGSSTTGTGYGSTGTGLGSTGHSATTSTGYGSTTGAGLNDPRSTNAGPHRSNMANTADPRVDSDRDGRGLGHGTTGTTGAGYGSTGTSGLDSTRTTGASGTGYGDPRSANDGPHRSNMANTADPRVDSDRVSSFHLDRYSILTRCRMVAAVSAPLALATPPTPATTRVPLVPPALVLALQAQATVHLPPPAVATPTRLLVLTTRT